MHEMARDAADLWVGYRLNDDAIAGPVVAKPADIFGSGYRGGEAQEQGQG